MKTSLIPLAIVFLATSAGAHEPMQHTAPATTQSTPDARLQPVVAVADRLSAALKSSDLGGVRALLDPHVLILESGGAERSADEYLSRHAIADAAFLGGATVKVLHRSGAIDGDTAWLATESDITPAAGSGAKPLVSTETLVLHRAQSTWRIVHVHWSSRSKEAAQ